MGKQAWNIIISGRTQEEGDNNGSHDIWFEMRCEHIFPSVFVELRTWNNNWSKLAQKILLTSGTTATVRIYGYSWGGSSAMRLAEELQKRGIEVVEMVLCDPVYRSQVPLVFLWRSMINKVWFAPKIKIPCNVRHVRWLRQRVNKPQGHDLVAVCPDKTIIDVPTLLQLPHGKMDESETYRNMAMEGAICDEDRAILDSTMAVLEGNL